MKIAVIGSGVSGLSAAWLLAKSHQVSLFEAGSLAGGHANTVDLACATGPVPVDTGFIVYNEPAYPNLTALLDHLDVETAPSSMTFAASLGGGAYEYAGGTGLKGFFGQPANLFRPAHWRLMADAIRFATTAAAAAERIEDELSLADFLAQEGYSAHFIHQHVIPMGAAIWSTPPEKMLEYPARSFINFYANHGLLRVAGHEMWRTVRGGSRNYVRALLIDSELDLRLSCPVSAIERDARGVTVKSARGAERFDRVLIATHSDQALRLLAEPSAQERQLLSAISYSPNTAVLHQDKRLMPKRKAVWASWNFIGAGPRDPVTVTYWMNRLQPLATRENVFVTLNPPPDVEIAGEVARFSYAHPNFDAKALAAQQALWTLQGQHHTWFAGAWWGSGFHEDGLQAGLAAAEDMGGVRRPWQVENESGRIRLGPPRKLAVPELAEAAE